MTESSYYKDLIALVADKPMEYALRGLLGRNKSLDIPPPSYDIFVHQERDPGCFLKGHELLRPQQHRYHHALILFDRIGCGQEKLSREEIEARVEDRMNRSGWNGRGAAIAIDPELENWVWADSPHVELALGWKGRSSNLRDWLITEGYLETETASKPKDPKKAVEDALKTVRKPQSASIYRQIAENITLTGCTDKAFLKFRQILSSWFTLSKTE